MEICKPYKWNVGNFFWLIRKNQANQYYAIYKLLLPFCICGFVTVLHTICASIWRWHRNSTNKGSITGSWHPSARSICGRCYERWNCASAVPWLRSSIRIRSKQNIRISQFNQTVLSIQCNWETASLASWKLIFIWSHASSDHIHDGCPHYCHSLSQVNRFGVCGSLWLMVLTGTVWVITWISIDSLL